jgi:ribonuclease P/MRP protein subunit POP1
VKWIETHVWHAKRFRIEERYGFKVPVKCFDKSERAAYRLS